MSAIFARHPTEFVVSKTNAKQADDCYLRRNYNLISAVFTKNAKRYMDINVAQTTLENDELWHERLGHIHGLKFLQLKRNQLHDDSQVLKSVNPIDKLCEACVYAKQARRPFAKERDRSHVNRPLYVIHTDVCGPITLNTFDNKNYFVTFIDEFTHYTTVYLMRNKSDVFTFLKDLMEKSRTMIYGAKLNEEFWGEAVLTATYLLNMSPTKAISLKKTPYELWHNKRPNIKHLRIFCLCVD